MQRRYKHMAEVGQRMNSSNASKTGLWNRVQPQWNMLTALDSVKELIVLLCIASVARVTAVRAYKVPEMRHWWRRKKLLLKSKKTRDFPKSYWFCYYPKKHLWTIETCSSFEPVKAGHFVFVREWHTTLVNLARFFILWTCTCYTWSPDIYNVRDLLILMWPTSRSREQTKVRKKILQFLRFRNKA